MRYQTLNCFDVDHIHDLRVASRRLRGAIDQLGPCIGAERMERLQRPIKRLTRKLGVLRNLDEAQLYFENKGNQGLESLLVSLRNQRRQEAATTKQMLERVDCMKLERKIRSAAGTVVTPDNIASQGLLAILSERNLELYRPIHALVPLAAGPKMVEERHSLRIALKKWRYFNELLHDMLGKQQSALLDLLRQYQALLGDMNDREVFTVLLDEAADLPETVRDAIKNDIVREQRKLLKKLCVLLDTKPLAYQFEL